MHQLLKVCGSLIFLALVLLLGFGLFGTSGTLTCKRLERKYVNCQHQRTYFYGLLSAPATSFRLTGAEVEEYVYKDSEGDSHNVYRMYLISGNEKIDFQEYENDAEQAFTEQVRFLELIAGIGEPSLNIHKDENIRLIMHDYMPVEEEL